MKLASSLSKVAAKVIKKFGVKCTFTHAAEDSFDHAQGIATQTETTFTGYGVKENYSKEEINGTTILASDIKLILEKTSQVPEVDDTCSIGGTEYRVMAVIDIDPSDEDIIYEVQLRS